MLPPPPPPPSARAAFLIFAPNLISWGVQLLLFGVSLPLYYRYRLSPSWNNNKRYLRTLVNVVMTLNAVQTLLNFGQIVENGVNQGHPTGQVFRWTVLDLLPTIPQLFIATTVTGHLARRSVSLIRNKVIKTVLIVTFGVSIAGIAAGSIATLVCGTFIVRGLDDRLGPHFSPNVTMAIYSCSSAFTDVLISASLASTLSREIRGFSQNTDNLLRRLISISVRTAAFTAVFALAGAILNLVFANSEYEHIGWIFLLFLPSLYTISLVTVVAAKDSVLTANSSEHSPTQAYSRTNATPANRTGTLSAAPGVSVKFETFRYVEEPSGAIEEKPTPAPSAADVGVAVREDEDDAIIAVRWA